MSFADDLNSIPQVKRAIVHCPDCGRTESVKDSHPFLGGWPKCCGFTMFLDTPEERDTLLASSEEKVWV